MRVPSHGPSEFLDLVRQTLALWVLDGAPAGQQQRRSQCQQVTCRNTLPRRMVLGRGQPTQLRLGRWHSPAPCGWAFAGHCSSPYGEIILLLRTPEMQVTGMGERGRRISPPVLLVSLLSLLLTGFPYRIPKGTGTGDLLLQKMQDMHYA